LSQYPTIKLSLFLFHQIVTIETKDAKLVFFFKACSVSLSIRPEHRLEKKPTDCVVLLMHSLNSMFVIDFYSFFFFSSTELENIYIYIYAVSFIWQDQLINIFFFPHCWLCSFYYTEKVAHRREKSIFSDRLFESNARINETFFCVIHRTLSVVSITTSVK
jgi:hypothetical protein